jgi:hypothetical protein
MNSKTVILVQKFPKYEISTHLRCLIPLPNNCLARGTSKRYGIQMNARQTNKTSTNPQNPRAHNSDKTRSLPLPASPSPHLPGRGENGVLLRHLVGVRPCSPPGPGAPGRATPRLAEPTADAAASPRDRAVLVRAGGDGEDKGGRRRGRRQQRRQPHDRQRSPGNGWRRSMSISYCNCALRPARHRDLFGVNFRAISSP